MIDTATAIASPQYIAFDREPSEPTPAGGRAWAVRGQNYTLDYVEAAPPALPKPEEGEGDSEQATESAG